MHLRKESMDLHQGGGVVRGRDTRAESLEFFMESILSNPSTSNASSLSNHLIHHASFPGIRKESVDIDMLALTDDDAAASALYFMQSSPMSPPMSHQLKSSIPIVAIGGSFSIPTSAASPLHVGISSSNVLSDSTLISLGIDSKSSPLGMKNESKVMPSPSTRRLRRGGVDDGHDNSDGHDGGSGMILNRIRGTTEGSFSLINADVLMGARSRAFSMSSFGGRSRARSVEEDVSETLIFLSSDHEDDANPFDLGYRHRSMSSDSFKDSLGEAIGDHQVDIAIAAEEEEEEDAILIGSVRSPNIIKIARPPITSQSNKSKTSQNQSKSKPPLPMTSRTRPPKAFESVKPKRANENTLPNSPEALAETRKRSSSMNSSTSDLLLSQDRRLRKRPKSKTIAHLRSDDEDDSSDDYYDDDEYGNNDNKLGGVKGGKNNRTSTPGGSNINNSSSNNHNNNRNLSNSKSSKSNSAVTATATPARNPMSPTMISSKTPGSNALNSKQKKMSIVKAETPGSVGSASNDQLQKLQKPKKKDDQVRIGIYTLEERKKKIERFLQQRNYRVWQMKIKYNVRKDFADSRLRVKGRFVRKEDEDQLKDIIKMLF